MMQGSTFDMRSHTRRPSPMRALSQNCRVMSKIPLIQTAPNPFLSSVITSLLPSLLPPLQCPCLQTFLPSALVTNW